MALKTDYKDFIPPDTGRRWKITQQDDGSVIIEDITEYQQEGDTLGAKDVNSIAKQSNAAMYPDIIDNSDFEVNQRGNESYTDGGFITYGGPDRWKQFQSTFNVKTKLLSKNGAGGSGQIFQLIPLSEKGLANGDTVTASLYVDGTLYSGSGEVKTSYPDYSLLIDETDFSVIIVSQEGLPDVVALTIQCKKEHPETIKIEKVKLEKGDVATPWQPKGYGAELAECLRYFQRHNDMWITPTGLYNGNLLFTSFNYFCPMRVKPTAKFISVSVGSIGVFTDTAQINEATTTSMRVSIPNQSKTPTISNMLQMTVEISADL